MSSTSENSIQNNSMHIKIISDNIANASTPGYKAKRPVFVTMSSNQDNTINCCGGNGFRILKTIADFNDGTFNQTDRDLDLAISQNGFFRLMDSQGKIYYTRDGQFRFDENHNIVNTEGMYLTGYNQKNLNNVSNNHSSIETINLNDAQILQAKKTNKIELKLILDSELKKNSEINYPVQNISPYLKNHTDYINIYDKDGKKENISINFEKKDNEHWKIIIQSKDDKNQVKLNSDFELTFDSNGELTSNPNMKIKVNNSPNDDIDINFAGTVLKPNSPNFIKEFSQNGHAAGVLNSLHISSNGEIIGSYSNTMQEKIGQILLSKFISPENLQPKSGNLWIATKESGVEQIGISGNNGFGTINSRNLEASNVDLNKELINMIIAQRNYQSSTQAFQAENKMINLLINLR